MKLDVNGKKVEGKVFPSPKGAFVFIDELSYPVFPNKVFCYAKENTLIVIPLFEDPNDSTRIMGDKISTSIELESFKSHVKDIAKNHHEAELVIAEEMFRRFMSQGTNIGLGILKYIDEMRIKWHKLWIKFEKELLDAGEEMDAFYKNSFIKKMADIDFDKIKI